MISPKSIFALTPTVDKKKTKDAVKESDSNNYDIEFLKQNSELNDPNKVMELTKDIKFYLLKLGLPSTLFARVPVSSLNNFFRGLKALDFHCSQSGMDVESGIHKIEESGDTGVIHLFQSIDILSEVVNGTKILDKEIEVIADVLNGAIHGPDVKKTRLAKNSPYYIDLSMPTHPYS